MMLIKSIKNIKYDNFGDTNFITGLRAYAALMVILIHSGGAGLRAFGDVGYKLSNLGASGVYIFFVISGYCIANSLQHNPDKKQFWYKRFWRIAPLYYSLCTAGLLSILIDSPLSYWYSYLDSTPLIYNVAMHISFLGFLDYRTANSFIGLEWSIMIEMFWYFIIPFILPLLNNWKRIALLFILTCACFISKEIYTIIFPEDIATLAMKWSPLRYAPAFFLGIVAYRIRHLFLNCFSSTQLVTLQILAIITALSDLLWLQIGNDFLTVIGLSFVILLTGSSHLFSKIIFENKAALFLGTISYSMYLTHMFFIKLTPNAFNDLAFTKFVAVLFLTIIASTVSYILIEQKGISLGKKLYKKHLDKVHIINA